jgi:hypothetical protein
MTPRDIRKARAGLIKKTPGCKKTTNPIAFVVLSARIAHMRCPYNAIPPGKKAILGFYRLTGPAAQARIPTAFRGTFAGII